MPLVNAKCTNCGANLEVDSAKDAANCPYCGAAYIVEKAINNYNITNNTTNNINAEVVNVYGGNGGDFVIRGGVLEKYTGAATDVVIPDGVVEIGQTAFSGCAGIRSVVIPTGVTQIGRRAKELARFNYDFDTHNYFLVNDSDGVFAGCRNLISITIPDSVIEIGEQAFLNCSNLKDVTMSASLKTIGNMAFAGCGSLTSLSLPDGLVKIGASAFHSTGLVSLSLPDSIETIGKSAFASSQITNINIPRNLSVISGFDSCSSLSAVDIRNDSNATIIGEEAFRFSGLSSIIIPDNVRFIGRHAFEYCNHLETVTIPKSVEEIGRGAFKKAKITTLNVMGEPKLEFSSYEDEDDVFTETSIESINADGNWLRRNRSCFSFSVRDSHKELFEEQSKGSQGFCYIATAVYGSYDCPQVWTLRRYRDNYLAESVPGRLFIHSYYAISPTIVRWFKDKDWFQRFWRDKLDKKVYKLNQKGYKDTPYSDK